MALRVLTLCPRRRFLRCSVALCELVVGLGVQEEQGHIVLVEDVDGCSPEAGGAWSAAPPVVALLRWVLVVYPSWLAVAAACMSGMARGRTLREAGAARCLVELVVRCGSRRWAQRSQSVLCSCAVARLHTAQAGCSRVGFGSVVAPARFLFAFPSASSSSSSSSPWSWRVGSIP